jgi:formylglycine-generating enzyme required for sulfatase activity
MPPAFRRATSTALVSVALAGVLPAPTTVIEAGAASDMVRVPSGSYRPLFGPARLAVAPFEMDLRPVTNGQFLEFVREHPEWRRSRVARIFADEAYLRHWRGDLDPGPLAAREHPVVYVSWFAARAYLAARKKRLPTVSQWEFASSLRRTNGVKGLDESLREWTEDFNSALVTGESRADDAIERSLFCGSGAIGAANREDYAAFLRYAFRSSLEARYGLANLGFRGVSDERRRRH